MRDSAIRPFRSVTVFGAATVDRVARTSAPPVAGASNPGTVHDMPGGVGANLACSLARLGVPVRLASRIGADAGGELVLARTKAAGVDTTPTSVSPDLPTATYQAVLDERGGLVIGVAAMGIFEQITPDSLTAALAGAPEDDLLVIDANLPDATLAFIAGESAGRPVAAMAVSPAKAKRLIAVLDRLDLVFANRLEAGVLLGRDGEDPAETLAAALTRRHVPNAVVTNGDRPLAAASAGTAHLFEPFPAEVRSVNGAGDALAAGTLFGLAGGRTLFDAVPFGLAAAAIKLASDSPVPETLSAASVTARLAALPSGSQP